MNKLKGNCFIGHDTSIYCTNTCEYTNICSCSGKNLRLVPPTKANICIYTRKLYNKANIFHENRLRIRMKYYNFFVLLKKQQSLKLSSAANYRWRLMG